MHKHREPGARPRRTEESVLFAAEDICPVTAGAIVHQGQRCRQDYGGMRPYMTVTTSTLALVASVCFSAILVFAQSFSHREITKTGRENRTDYLMSSLPHVVKSSNFYDLE